MQLISVRCRIPLIRPSPSSEPLLESEQDAMGSSPFTGLQWQNWYWDSGLNLFEDRDQIKF